MSSLVASMTQSLAVGCLSAAILDTKELQQERAPHSLGEKSPQYCYFAWMLLSEFIPSTFNATHMANPALRHTAPGLFPLTTSPANSISQGLFAADNVTTAILRSAFTCVWSLLHYSARITYNYFFLGYCLFLSYLPFKSKSRARERGKCCVQHTAFLIDFAAFFLFLLLS